MTPEQALNLLYNAAQQARLTAQEHDLVKQAVMVLHSLMTKQDDKIKED